MRHYTKELSEYFSSNDNSNYTIKHLYLLTDCQSNIFDNSSNLNTLEDWKIAKVKYKSDRASSYASIGEQLDMQYWDAVNGTTTWKDHIAKVKSDNPKPS